MNRRAAVALIVFVAALAIYLFTLAPAVALIDSGELTEAAWSLGNAHPPGFPLFVLLTHLFTLLPVHSVAWRANLASAIFSAAAAAFTALAAFEILETQTPLPPGEGCRGAAGEGQETTKDRRVATSNHRANPADDRNAIAAGLLLAFSKTVWRYPVETEVYALNTALMAAARRDLYDRLDDLILAIIAHQLRRGPVYLTIDTALADQRDKKLIERLKKDHDIVPQGIVMEVVQGHVFRDVKWTPIATRGLIDGTVRYDDDDPVPNELLPTYRAAFLTRARYFAITRHVKEAVADYQQAFALDPENSMIERQLTGVQAMPH